MGWRRLGLDELLAGPIGWWWWRDHHRVGARSAARKQFDLARSLAELAVLAQGERFFGELDAHRLTSTGVPVTTADSMCSALEIATLPMLAGVSEAIAPQPDLQHWWLANEAGINELTLWLSSVFLLTDYLGVAPVCVQTTFDESRARLHRKPRHAALAYANFVVGSYQGAVVGAQRVAFFGLVKTVTEMGWPELMSRVGMPPLD